MDHDIQILAGSPLFSGIREDQIPDILLSLHAPKRHHGKGSFIIHAGDPVQEFGIVLRGGARSCKTDSEGRTITITRLAPGSAIGVLLAAGPGHESPVSVESLDDTWILIISYRRFVACCGDGKKHHMGLLQNYMSILAEKGLILHQRIDCLLKPDLRTKIMTYLERESRKADNPAFTIPFDRAAMAEYLNVDRSALSRELSRMRRDSLLYFSKNQFELKKNPIDTDSRNTK